MYDPYSNSSKKPPYSADSDDVLPAMQPRVLKAALHENFDVSLTNVDIDLQQLIQRLAFVREFNGLNLLFHGVPGTGKSQYAQFMAYHLKIPTVVVSSGDIMFSKLGLSERVIRYYFDYAAKNRCMLLIDEADSLLYARKDAKYTWEIQIVNEFIQCLDRSTVPVVCTTNNMEDLDPAILRRFMFKAQFRQMTNEQRRKAFTSYFKQPYPEYIDKLPMLSLADFGLIHKKANILGYLHDLPQLLQLFYDEAVAKQAFAERQKIRRRKDNTVLTA